MGLAIRPPISITRAYAGVEPTLQQALEYSCGKTKARLFSPWAVTSTVAAAMLLLLTITQTIAANLSLSNGWKK